MRKVTVMQGGKLQEILEAGIVRASNSFGRILGADVVYDSLEIFQAARSVRVYPCFKSATELYTLVTPLMGSLQGKSYLVFDDNDMKVLAGYDPLRSFPSDNREMTEAVLKEIDNILSAAFITELSQQLQVSIFGNVPELSAMSALTINEFINNERTGSRDLIFQTTFGIEGRNGFSPQFIWSVSGIGSALESADGYH